MDKIFEKIIKYSLLFSLIFTENSYAQSIRSILKNSESELINYVYKNQEKFEVQIILTELKKRKNGFTIHKKKFNVDKKNYFYPASSIKLPIALLTIEKINENPNLNINSEFLIEGDSIITTFKKEITDLFIISSNESYNRLFEFLGQDYINKKLKQKGFKDFSISHRLSTDKSDNLKTKEINFYRNGEINQIQKSINNKPLTKLNLKNLNKGVGFTLDNDLQNKSMDFSRKNYFSIEELNNILICLFFPEVSKNKKFNLSKSQNLLIQKLMSSTPLDMGFDKNIYPNNYNKFFIYGDKDGMINDNIYNKVGNAYGYSIDNAYIYNKSSNRHFVLTACIYTNSNNILNDNKYEYDEIGIPFLAKIGRFLTNYNFRQ
ncbi:class A beta-lactamase-related serine hydrolase [Flavobacteriaceae bacterium]|nr:serine hydrolase [Flavobacteriaceae bacterium]MDA9849088.1 class A beta-lactamase-related serine hydrolase [Flavobacteriaceae bacterium]